MAFVIKRGDHLPHLPFQFFEPDGITPLDTTAATAIRIVVRVKGEEPVTFKKLVTMTDALNGIGHYDWSDPDTATPGSYEYEFEIEWSTGEIQTIPVDAYLDLRIVDDIG